MKVYVVSLLAEGFMDNYSIHASEKTAWQDVVMFIKAELDRDESADEPPSPLVAEWRRTIRELIARENYAGAMELYNCDVCDYDDDDPFGKFEGIQEYYHLNIAEREVI